MNDNLSEAYLELSRTSMMERFCENSYLKVRVSFLFYFTSFRLAIYLWTKLTDPAECVIEAENYFLYNFKKL